MTSLQTATPWRFPATHEQGSCGREMSWVCGTPHSSVLVSLITILDAEAS